MAKKLNITMPTEVLDLRERRFVTKLLGNDLAIRQGARTDTTWVPNQDGTVRTINTVHLNDY